MYTSAWFCIHWDVSSSSSYHEDAYLFSKGFHLQRDEKLHPFKAWGNIRSLDCWIQVVFKELGCENQKLSGERKGYWRKLPAKIQGETLRTTPLLAPAWLPPAATTTTKQKWNNGNTERNETKETSETAKNQPHLLHLLMQLQNVGFFSSRDWFSPSLSRTSKTMSGRQPSTVPFPNPRKKIFMECSWTF